MAKLRGRRVAITGGAQGIGRAIGEALISAGATVALGDVQEAAVRQTATEIGATGCHLDVTDPASFEGFLDRPPRISGGSTSWSTTRASCRSGRSCRRAPPSPGARSRSTCWAC